MSTAKACLAGWHELMKTCALFPCEGHVSDHTALGLVRNFFVSVFSRWPVRADELDRTGSRVFLENPNP